MTQATVDKIMSYVNTNYDARVFDDSLPIIRNEAKKYAKDMYEKMIKGQYVDGKENVIQLMYNHFYKNKPIAYYLSGPMSLTLHYSKKYNKTIYVFGEYHGLDMNCGEMYYDIVKYLTEILDSTDVFIDVFMEFTENKPFHYIHNSDIDESVKIWNNRKYIYLQRLKYWFGSCLYQHDSCKWKNISRIHNLDIRAYDIHKNRIGVLYDILTDVDPYNIPEDVMDKINNIISYSLDEWVQYVKGSFPPVVNKEMGKTNIQKDILHQWYNSIININVVEAWENLHELVEMSDISDSEKLSTVKMLLTMSEVVITDIYAVSRMFKQFDVGTNDQPHDAKNIIVYAGDAHSSNYRLLLDMLGFEKIDAAEKKYKRCLDMVEFPQPFFGK